MEKFKALQEYLATLQEDISKFYEKENFAAGTRLRKAMQEVKRLAQEIRDEVQSKRKGGEEEGSSGNNPA